MSTTTSLSSDPNIVIGPHTTYRVTASCLKDGSPVFCAEVIGREGWRAQGATPREASDALLELLPILHRERDSAQ